jgi:hypothetical protein
MENGLEKTKKPVKKMSIDEILEELERSVDNMPAFIFGGLRGEPSFHTSKNFVNEYQRASTEAYSYMIDRDEEDKVMKPGEKNEVYRAMKVGRAKDFMAGHDKGGAYLITRLMSVKESVFNVINDRDDPIIQESIEKYPEGAGNDTLLAVGIIVPEEHYKMFKELFKSHGGVEAINQIFERVCPYMKVKPNATERYLVTHGILGKGKEKLPNRITLTKLDDVQLRTYPGNRTLRILVEGEYQPLGILKDYSISGSAQWTMGLVKNGEEVAEKKLEGYAQVTRDGTTIYAREPFSLRAGQVPYFKKVQIDKVE